MCKIKVYSRYYNLRHLYTCTSFALHWVKIQYLSTSDRWFFSFKIYNITKVLQLKFDVRFKKTMHGWKFNNNQCTATVQGKLSILMKGWLTFEFVTLCICICVRSLPVAVGCFTKWCSRCIFRKTLFYYKMFIHSRVCMHRM